MEQLIENLKSLEDRILALKDSIYNKTPIENQRDYIQLANMLHYEIMLAKKLLKGE